MNRVGLPRSPRRLRLGLVGWVLCGFFSMASAPELAWAERPAQSRLRGDVVELRLKLERDPRDVATLVKLSKKLIKLREFQEALTHLRVASDASPRDAQVQYLVAFTLRRLKRYREAVSAYERFLEHARGAQRNSGVFGLAKALELQGDTERAAEFYQRFIEIEKRPERRQWVAQARKSIQRLRASQVALIGSEQDPSESDETRESSVRGKPTADLSPPSSSSSSEKPQPDTSSGAQGVTADQAPQQVAPQANSAGDQRQPRRSSTPLNTALAQADQLFADREYRQATQNYQALAQRDLPIKLRTQLHYFAAVSAYLSAQFTLAQREAELGLLDDPKSSKLRGLAVLSFVQKRERETRSEQSFQSAFSQIRLALREGRFNTCLELIEALVEGGQTSVPSNQNDTSDPRNPQGDDQRNSKRNSKKTTQVQRAPLADPLLLHAKGRALLGLKRYQEAYLALSQAARGFRHPHLTLDLALTAQRMGNMKRARAHFSDLKAQTAPTGQRSGSLLHKVAREWIESEVGHVERGEGHGR